jgi:hypothetical protein
MASIPTQEEVLAATRKSQEAMMAAIKTWLETVRTAAPKLPSKLPQVSLPFADKLPTPQDAVANAYHLAEQLLASQRKFAEELVKVTAPLRTGFRDSSPEVPNRSAWQDAVTDSEPKTPAVSTAPRAVTSPQPKAADRPEPRAADRTTPKAADSPQPKAADRPQPKAADSTTPAPRTAAKRTTAGSASTTVTSARKSATGTSARKSTTASSAGSARKSAGTTTPAPKGADKS